MAFRGWGISAVLLFPGAALLFSQPAPIVQPGAPGHAGKVLAPSAAITAPRPLLKADIDFMQGMIHHHQQAVDMVDLMQKNTRNKRLLAFGKRISISQTDEIKFMQQWLEERGQAVPMGHGHMGHDMGGMKM